MLKFEADDGGRDAAGFRGSAGDCGVRSIAIATGLEYREVYDAINELGQSERVGKRKRKRSSAREGVYVQTMHKFLESVGWVWTPTMAIGSGCTVRMRADDLPKGRLICRVSRHYVAVVDHVIRDTHDPSRGGTRCVYGYWSGPML